MQQYFALSGDCALSTSFIQKRKGLFHHSSFLAGGATLAAGRLEAEGGKLKV
jgi:hypothetical protein